MFLLNWNELFSNPSKCDIQLQENNKNTMNLKLPIFLLDWINSNKINWKKLSFNPSKGAIQLLEKIKKKYIGGLYLIISQKVL